MAVNDEKLKVQFEVDLEQLKKQLGQAGVAFDATAKQAVQSSERIAQSITKVEKNSNFLVAKLKSIGKATAAAFAFDLGAKVLGFGGIMDIVSKATDGLAAAIRNGAKEIIGLSDKIDRPAENLKTLKERLDALRESLGADTFKIDAAGGGSFFGALPDIKDVEGQARALQLVVKAQEEINKLTESRNKKSLFGNAPTLSADNRAAINAADLPGFQSEQIVRQLNADLRKLSETFEANEKKVKSNREEHEKWIKALERGAAATRREQAEAGAVRFANPFANVAALAGQNAIDRTRQRAFDIRSAEIKAAERDDARLQSFVSKALALSRAVADATLGTFEEIELARKRADFTAWQSQKFLDDYAATIERTRLEAELAADPFDQLNAALVQISDTAETRRLNLYQQFVADGDQEKLREFLALVDKIEAKQIAAAKSTGTFAGQVDVRMKQIAESISNIGGQTVDVAFDSFRGFFRDILSGTASAGEAFRSFAASVVAGLADMLAQWLALQAVGFLFPGFGAAGGAAFGASRAAPGGTGAPATGGIYGFGSGAAGGGFGAQRGGAPVTINLVVQSLDPRTAADVVLGAMPQIQGALAAVISGGSDRRLLEQLRAVRG